MGTSGSARAHPNYYVVVEIRQEVVDKRCPGGQAAVVTPLPDRGAKPAPGRRPRLGTASARSTLLTVLGEFVHPRGQGVWTSTLVAALAALDIEEKSARQALTRTAAEGLLVSARHGRRVLWELTPAGTALLEEGTRHIYGFMRDSLDWDGRWLVVSV